ncbi:MAG: hypothetical protein K1Y36_16235 [Blastocatellia bacterium]|nr:hypothetical protein [Blastocatellia bacterium]
MSSSSIWLQFLSANLSYFPFLLVYLIGILICVMRWKLHPRVSLYSLIAFGLFLISWFINITASFILFRMAMTGGAPRDWAVLQGLSRLVTTGLSLVSWTLLIITNFYLRQPEAVAPVPGQYQYPPKW